MLVAQLSHEIALAKRRRWLCLAPGRRTNRKNFRNCQSTIVFYTLYFFGQWKKHKPMCFGFNRVQPVHRGVQRKWCSGRIQSRVRTPCGRGFRGILEFLEKRLLN